VNGIMRPNFFKKNY